MRLLLKPLILAAGLAAAGFSADANTLRYAESQDISSMDPHAARDDFMLNPRWRKAGRSSRPPNGSSTSVRASPSTTAIPSPPMT
ncbi:MAG: hypothetical protein MUE98_06705 [Rhodobacteraceae bacterium]|nr:hypothetical protein [Paracoccaceae bacterium]